MAKKSGKARSARTLVAKSLASGKSLAPAILDAYKRMLSYQFIGTLLLVAFMVVGLFGSYIIATKNVWAPPLLVLVMFAGGLGAFFSALTRLYNVDELSVALISPTISRLGGRYLLMYSLVPPLVGAVAAVVLYIAFVGDIINGGVFPQISCKTADKCDTLIGVLSNFGPTEAKDYGKALIWAFISGFSERLVPDTLQTLVAKQDRQTSPRRQANSN